MKKLNKLITMFLAMTMSLVLVACSGNGGNKADTSKDAGVWLLSSMTADGETMDEEFLDSIGLVGMFWIELKEDGTGTISIDQEYDLTWTPGKITADGETMEYTVKDDVMTMEFEGDSLSFKKGSKDDIPSSTWFDDSELLDYESESESE